MNARELFTPYAVVNGWRWRVVCCLALVDVDLEGPLAFDHHERGRRTMHFNMIGGSIDFA